MKLRVGIIGSTFLWQEILAQEGVPFAQGSAGEMCDSCSVVIAAKPLDGDERREVSAFLAKGGSLLAYAEFIEGVAGATFREERIDYIVSDHDTLFPSIHLLDLGIIGAVPREANCLRTQENIHAVFAGTLGGGNAVLLPFDPAAMIADTRQANKSFYARLDRLPAERVSAVTKGELRHLVHDALAYLHGERGLPYVHLWYFPFAQRNLFAFRIDTDRGTREEIDKLCSLAISHNIHMTFFADVKSHEEWLHHFAFLSGQEVGVHCYEHVVFSNYEDNLKNIQAAKRKLQHVGVSAEGFAAPFGMWNHGLARAIDEAEFDYSSEFSYAYDTFPFYTVTREQRFNTLQIPIHPVCIGSMIRVGYSAERMVHYFLDLIRQKMERDEPLFFYHHPTHHRWDVVEEMFAHVNGLEIENMAFGEFARWWKARLSARIDAESEASRLSIKSDNRQDAVWMRVIAPDGREAVIGEDGEFELANLPWHPKRSPVPPPEDCRSIRAFDPRREFGEVFTAIARKFTERRPRK